LGGRGLGGRGAGDGGTEDSSSPSSTLSTVAAASRPMPEHSDIVITSNNN